MRLEAYCKSCSSWRWCGRPCSHAPEERQSGDAVSPVDAGGNDAEAARPVLADSPEGQRPCGVAKDAPASVRSGGSTHRYRDPERWRVYMREYMRKRRANERAG